MDICGAFREWRVDSHNSSHVLSPSGFFLAASLALAAAAVSAVALLFMTTTATA